MVVYLDFGSLYENISTWLRFNFSIPVMGQGPSCELYHIRMSFNGGVELKQPEKN